MFLYLRIYQKPDGNFITYTGITKDVHKRNSDHDKGFGGVTRTYEKLYTLRQVRFRVFGAYNMKDCRYIEKRFKRLSFKKKLEESFFWKRIMGTDGVDPGSLGLE